MHHKSNGRAGVSAIRTPTRDERLSFAAPSRRSPVGSPSRSLFHVFGARFRRRLASILLARLDSGRDVRKPSAERRAAAATFIRERREPLGVKVCLYKLPPRFKVRRECDSRRKWSELINKQKAGSDATAGCESGAIGAPISPVPSLRGGGLCIGMKVRLC